MPPHGGGTEDNMAFFNSFSKSIIDTKEQREFLLYYIKHIVTIIILPLSLFFITFSLLYVNSFNENNKSHVRSTAEKNASIIDHVFFSVDTYYKSCLTDQNISNLRTNPVNINNMTGQFSPVYEAAKNASNLNLYINCIDSVYLYVEKYDYVYVLKGTSPSYFDKFYDKVWYQHYLQSGCSDYISLIDNNGDKQLTFCYNLNTVGQEPKSVLVIQVSAADLANRFNLISDNYESMKLVSGIDNSVLLDYDSFSGKGFEYSVQLENYPATLNYSLSYESLKNRRPFRAATLILFIAAALILTVLLSFLFSKKEYSKILSVVSQIEDPYIGNGSGANKVYTLIKGGNDSAVHDYESKLLERITNLKKAQLIALQTQINPHFLFNTLYMISSTIIVNNDQDTDAVNMISKLSDILRYSLKTEEYIVTLDEELKILQSYISILSTRHGDTFDVEWYVTDDILHESTLKSIIQPLIENSVEHGIQLVYDEKRGLIKISIYKENNMLYISVTDNGAGISPEKIKELNELFSTDYIFRNTHIGLKNVISRIKILFGDQAGYSIESDSEQTRITIYHPLIN